MASNKNQENKAEIATEHAESYEVSGQTQRNGRYIRLIPEPSSDPLDPLNWSMGKKIRILLLASLAAFSGTLQALGNSSGFAPQAILYSKSLTAISYTVCAAIAGMAAGPFFWIPISKLRRVGRCGCILWSLVIALLLNVWSARMTGPNDYIPFTISRLFAAMAGSGSITIGADLVVETFFLHQRGRALAVYASMTLFGTVASGTFSGFIADSADWTIQYWYNIAFEGALIIACILWLDDSGWTRDESRVYPALPQNPIKRRLVLYTFSGAVMPKATFKEIRSAALTPILLLVTPVTIIAGSSIMVSFGWSVGKQTMLAVFLQTPKEAGGYGFSAKGTAYFTFSNWVGVAAAQAYCIYINDRLPLWVSKRFGNGLWKPEYRLHALWLPLFILEPIGLGIFGASLQYQLHYMVLAFASFLITFSDVIAAPVFINYIVETYRHLPSETAAVMNFYRTILGLALPFFITPWTTAVGPGWVFGMQAFFALLADGLILVLFVWGPVIRTWNILAKDTLEEEQQVIGDLDMEKNLTSYY